MCSVEPGPEAEIGCQGGRGEVSHFAIFNAPGVGGVFLGLSACPFFLGDAEFLGFASGTLFLCTWRAPGGLELRWRGASTESIVLLFVSGRNVDNTSLSGVSSAWGAEVLK